MVLKQCALSVYLSGLSSTDPLIKNCFCASGKNKSFFKIKQTTLKLRGAFFLSFRMFTTKYIKKLSF